MAEVLSFLASPSNDPASLIHSRSSSSESYQPARSSAPQHRVNQMSRNQYNSQHTGGSGYRGTSGAPIAPYAFKTTPQLRNDGHSRTSSSPSSSSPLPLSSESSSAGNRQRYPAPPSVSTTSSTSSTAPALPALAPLPSLSKDDTISFSNFTVPSFSTDVERNNGAPLLDAAKPSPERYRRGHRRAETGSSTQAAPATSSPEGPTAPGASGTGKMGQFFYSPQQTPPAVSRASPVNTTTNGRHQADSPIAAEHARNSSLASNAEKADVPKRYRRQASFGNSVDGGTKTPTPPGSRSGAPSPNEPASPDQLYARQDTRPASSGSAHGQNSTFTRSFPSADAVRRINNPSPLSRPYATGETPPSSEGYGSNGAASQSPAVAAMAALNVNDKDANKGVKSRIRRAFSFGGAQELKRTTIDDTAADRAKARQEQFSSELDEEQDAIARNQEASGLGNNIYSGQGNVFTGSTDNLSISSTASSASLMLRKMGKNMKKGGRSIKGLFRPKSVIGVPAADAPTQPSVGPVSMVTVEAEREQVNVNANPHDQVGGGTGFPRLERNSLDAARISSPSNFETIDHGDVSSRDPRRSIVGGEQERAEVLAAVKRGILKRTGTSSPVASPLGHPADGTTDQPSPSSFRRGSPAPSTTSSEPRRTGHRRTDSHTIEGDDYFASVPRLQSNNNSSRSLPGTPRGTSRNISFSPRIQFHDVWSSSEYDRRGDIATCNRLTPMLAQQIKEELNTFKMEMEVHEQSKPHTHFF